MPYGIIINCGTVALGGLLGALLGTRFPSKIADCLSQLFGITSITIGVTLIVKMSTLSAVMLALLLGAAMGEMLKLEDRLRDVCFGLRPLVTRAFRRGDSPDSVDEFIGVVILICTGSTGLLGAMTEGMTGDTGILIAKSVLDLFGAAIFAATLGGVVAFIALPQFIIYFTLYLCAQFIVPLTTTAMISDFMACGGIIALVTGLRIAKIKFFCVTNLLPALVLVMPLSWLWAQPFAV